jgi:hypothetical protein
MIDIEFPKPRGRTLAEEQEVWETVQALIEWELGTLADTPLSTFEAFAAAIQDRQHLKAEGLKVLERVDGLFNILQITELATIGIPYDEHIQLLRETYGGEW